MKRLYIIVKVLCSNLYFPKVLSKFIFMKLTKVLGFSCLLLSIISFNACRPDEATTPTTVLGKKSSEFDANVVNAWYGHSLELVKTTKGYTPPVAARNFGYLGVALYEAILPGSPNNISMAGQLNGLTAVPNPEFGKEYYMPACANAVMAKMNIYLFPLSEAKKANFDSIATIKNYYDGKFKANGVAQDVLDRSNAYGEAIATAIYEWSKADVIGHEGFRKNFPASYTPPTGEGFWVPTSTQLIPLQPFWGSIRNFIPNSITSSQPGLPPPFSKNTNSDMYNYAIQVFNTVKNITPEQKATALYWADGGGTVTPPGHSLAIAKQLSEEKSLSLDKSAELFAKTGLAVADAFIACWKCKYTYNLMRPETYIKQNIEPTWKPVIATPPFPEYISGHSTQAAAAAYVFSSLFGGNSAFTDKTNTNRKDIDGQSRTYANFMLMAEEAAKSRLYGGIHYQFGNDNGLTTGLKIGKALDNIKFVK
jgi:hypothetical protein